MPDEFSRRHPRDKPPSDGDDRSRLAVLRERVDQHHVRIEKHDETIDDLCERMTILETMRASGVKVSWFVASAISSLVVGIAVVVVLYWMGFKK